MARKSEPRISDIQMRVIPALRLRGSRKAVMPFEIASTPVRAVVPLEKACRIRKRPIACRLGDLEVRAGSGPFRARPTKWRRNAVPTVRNIMTTKK